MCIRDRGYVFRRSCDLVAPLGPAHGAYKPRTAKVAQKLLQILLGHAAHRGDALQRERPLARMGGQVVHGLSLIHILPSPPRFILTDSYLLRCKNSCASLR